MWKGLQFCHDSVFRSQLLTKILMASQNCMLEAGPINFRHGPPQIGQRGGLWKPQIYSRLVLDSRDVYTTEVFWRKRNLMELQQQIFSQT